MRAKVVLNYKYPWAFFKARRYLRHVIEKNCLLGMNVEASDVKWNRTIGYNFHLVAHMQEQADYDTLKGIQQRSLTIILLDGILLSLDVIGINNEVVVTGPFELDPF